MGRVALALMMALALQSGARADSRSDWAATLWAYLKARSTYPAAAQASHAEGVVQVYFVIDRRGDVRSARIVRSSGSLVLDAQTLMLLYNAQPLPAPPADVKGELIPITIPIRYSLQR